MPLIKYVHLLLINALPIKFSERAVFRGLFWLLTIEILTLIVHINFKHYLVILLTKYHTIVLNNPIIEQ